MDSDHAAVSESDPFNVEGLSGNEMWQQLIFRDQSRRRVAILEVRNKIKLKSAIT